MNRLAILSLVVRRKPLAAVAALAQVVRIQAKRHLAVVVPETHN
jgi:hypothetical protein